MALTLAERPSLSGLPAVAHVQRKRLLGQSSLGVRTSFAVYPVVPAHGLATEGTSLGVSCPFSAYRGRESTARPVTQPDTPGLPGFCRRFPRRQLRCRPQAFSTSRRPSSTLHRPAIFQTGGAPGIHPSGALASRAGLTARRRQHSLLTFLPLVAQPQS